jgi:hypothetical protein
VTVWRGYLPALAKFEHEQFKGSLIKLGNQKRPPLPRNYATNILEDPELRPIVARLRIQDVTSEQT